MVWEVEEEAISIPELKSSESIVIRYPMLGGGDGAVQETNTVSIPFCLTVRLVGVVPNTNIEKNKRVYNYSITRTLRKYSLAD